MPPEQTSADILDRLPPDVAAYFVVACVVWWLTRAVYRDQTQLLDRYETRLDQIERSQAGLAQALEQARDAERRCQERMTAMEERYERRIAELEHEVHRLREISEPMEVT